MLPQRTRIVCTLGPATDSDDMVRGLIRAGMDVARLNFSHGDHATHTARIARVRRLAREESATIALMGDLQGPKIRIGVLAQAPVMLVDGATFTLTTRVVEGNSEIASIDLPELPHAASPGDRILIDDGAIELRVLSKTDTDVVTQVVEGGELKSRKGVNLPNVPLQLSALTPKDRTDALFAVEQELDYLALSFVRRADDVLELRRLIAGQNAFIPIIAKIEKPEALDQIDAIIAVSDGVMVARGDLGVETPPEQVPIYQKTIIRKANAVGKPVITATQMLESMIANPRPTRAEASDVANAILDGTDAVMLSGETAAGKYPLQATEIMARIAQVTEERVRYRGMPRENRDASAGITDVIGNAVGDIAKQLNARLIIALTSSGHTARMISRHRAPTPILAVTSNERTQRRLALVWGVRCALLSHATSAEAIIAESLAAAMEQGLIEKGQIAVITAGVPAGIAGRTNMIQVRVAGEGE
ncbi:MAG: pyruvate kinase [Chloroflexi bacterium]|nr:pyruvate kinase [Chloroflexota bacterium]